MARSGYRPVPMPARATIADPVHNLRTLRTEETIGEMSARPG
jgi:hypothetical protein